MKKSISHLSSTSSIRNHIEVGLLIGWPSSSLIILKTGRQDSLKMSSTMSLFLTFLSKTNHIITSRSRSRVLVIMVITIKIINLTNNQKSKILMFSRKGQNTNSSRKDRTTINNRKDKITINNRKDRTTINSKKDRTTINNRKDRIIIEWIIINISSMMNRRWWIWIDI